MECADGLPQLRVQTPRLGLRFSFACDVFVSVLGEHPCGCARTPGLGSHPMSLSFPGRAAAWLIYQTSLPNQAVACPVRYLLFTISS